jgi:two-component system response regulator HydG
LLLGDDSASLDSLYRVLKNDSCDVVCCRNADQATRMLQVESVSLCVPVLEAAADATVSLGWLRRSRAAHRSVDFLVLLSESSVALAVEAMRLGVRHVLDMPCKPSHLLEVVQEILGEQGRDGGSRPATVEDVFSGIIGTSPAIHEILELVRRVGPSSATVLLEGESGTGKELLARAIQQCSLRRQQPFIRVNCAALPETLMESELFGHERGAFTGAVRARAGRFELADKGTLFLDEIGDMSLSTQTKLLRVLQEGEVDRVGGTSTRHVDVRVIAATNVDLQKAVREKRFREDLYYRLRVVQLRVPSLRERRGDIPMLVEYFLTHYAQRDGKSITGVEPRAMQSLLEYHWPGNVRELENAIERGVALTTEGPLCLDCLPPEFRQRRPRREVTFSIGTSIADIERRMIAETLRYTDGDKNHAARLLGITVRTIYRKLERRRLDLSRWNALDRGAATRDPADTQSPPGEETAVDEGRLDTSRRRGS